MQSHRDTMAEAARNTPQCECRHDPYTWIVNDPIDGRVICFGCRECGQTWTRIAPEGIQRGAKK